MRRSVRRIRRTFFAACFMFLFTVTVIAGHSMLTTLAEEEKPKIVPYYSSIEIQEGDSLWGIANRYRKGSHLTTEEYVEKLRQMNTLREDTIHVGAHLTIVYYK